MKITSKLSIISIITLVAIAVMVGLFAWSSRVARMADDNENLAAEMQRAAFTTMLLSDEYLISHAADTAGRLKEQIKEFRRLLEQAGLQFVRENELDYLKTVTRTFNDMEVVHSRIIDLHSRRNIAGNKTHRVGESEVILFDQLRQRAYDLNNHIDALLQSSREHERAMQQRAQYLLFAMALSLIIALLVNHVAIRRLVIRKMRVLRTGAETIGSGRLDHRILLTGEDEFSALASDMNAMATKLGSSLASLVELHAEVSRRKGSEAALVERGKLLHAVLNSARDVIIFSLDQEYRYTSFNDGHRAEMIKVYGVQIAVGMSMLDAITVPEVRPLAKASFDRALKGESFTDIQQQVNTGATYEFVWNPVRGSTGNVEGLTVFVRNITDRVKTERALQDSKALLFNAFNNSPLLMAISEMATGKYLEVNDSFCQVTGFSREEAIGKTSVELGWISPETRERMVKALKQDGRVAGMELTLRSKSGKMVICRFTGDIVQTPEGVKLFSTAEDITLLKESENALRERDAGYRAAIETTSDGFYLLDDQGRILEVNAAAVRQSGYGRAELLTMQITDLEAMERPPETKNRIETIMRKGGDLFESKHRSKDGTIWHVEIGVSFWAIDGGRFFCFIRDISERKRSAEQLLKNQALLAATAAKAKMGGWEIDLPSRTLTWTDEIYRIYEVEAGFKPTVEGTIAFYAPESLPIIAEAVQRAIEYDESFDLELYLITARNNRRLVNATGQAHRIDGKVVKVGGTFQDITERRAMEYAIKQSATQWQQTFDAVQDAIILLDTSYTIQRCNRAFADFVGVPINGIAGKTCWQIMHGSDGPIKDCPVAQVMGSRKRESLDLELGERWYKVSADPVFNDDGDIAGLIHIMSDITEYKRTEQERLLNEKRIQALLDLSQMSFATEEEICAFALEAVVVLTQSRGGYLHFFDEDNKSILLTSWSKEVLKICSASAGTHYPLDKAGIWADSVRQRRPVIHNDLSGHAEGKGFPEGHFPIERHMSVPVFEGDRIVAIAGVGNKKAPYADMDVNQLTLFMTSIWKVITQKRTLDALGTSERRFRRLYQEFDALLDSNPDMQILLTPDLTIQWANKGAEAASGHSTEILNGQKCYAIIHKRTEPCEACPVLRCFRTGRIETEVMSTPEGSIRDVRAVPIRDETGRIVNVIDMARDITEHRRMETQLLHAQKMEAIGTLAGGIAHDFNNVLNVIMGYAGVLQFRNELSPEGSEYLKEIMASVERAAHLTRGILAFSRKQALSLKLIDPKDVINSILKMLGRILGEDIRIETSLDNEALQVMADFVQMEQVLMNFATNARDAMQKGGVFRIACSRGSIDREFVDRNGFGRPGDYAVITVSDTGHGMPEDVRMRIFEPFFTTKEIGRGTGLGMSIVFGIIKQHNGFIVCESEPGNGTTFRMYLPLRTAVHEGEVMSVPETSRIVMGKGTVLLVEDETALRQLLKIILEHGGYTVLGAASGDEAIGVFDAYSGAIDIVVMDMLMPGRNGLETRDELWKRRPDLPCIFVSGYSTPMLEERGITPGEITLLDKPVAPQRLLQEVRDQIEAAGMAGKK